MKYLFAVFLLLSVNLSAQPKQDKFYLTIKITGIKKITGTVEIGLYNNEKNFPKEGKEYLTKSVPVKEKHINCVFRVPAGTYAVALYHDADGNKKCDKNMAGIPKEGFAFSNNIKPRFTAPKFRDCKIDVKKNVITEIRLIYY